MRVCSKCHLSKEDEAFLRRNHGAGSQPIFCSCCLDCRRQPKKVNNPRPGRPAQRKRKFLTRSFQERATYLLQEARRRAKAKGVPFSIDHSFIKERLERGVCEATGLKLSTEFSRGPRSPSIDRIIPSMGYTPSNTQVVCLQYNMAKGPWIIDSLHELALAMRTQ